jgi:hypothetical protein
MFIIYPDRFLTPAYRISPFATSDIGKNQGLINCSGIDDYFKSRFRGLRFNYTTNGKQALNIALSHYRLSENDVVTILTSSGNFYISSCVTNEIEKFCKWSREILPETKVLFVNHEFGYPYPEIQKLKLLNLPIIEDCAGSFFSEDNENTIGRTGDFVIYSFPKMFPIQVGGLLVSASHINHDYTGHIQPGMLRYIKSVLSEHIKRKDQIIRQRIYNYTELRSRFEKSGLSERFKLEQGIVPGVFMFRTDNQNLNLPELKKHFWAHGIQSSIFYGEDAFFIPVHQALTAFDLDYFYEVMKVFLQKADT